MKVFIRMYGCESDRFGLIAGAYTSYEAAHADGIRNECRMSDYTDQIIELEVHEPQNVNS